MPNMKMIISGQASKKLRNFRDSETNNTPNIKRLCNCRQANSCPVNGNCLMESVIYKATVTANNIARHYFGLTEGHFKDRWDKHRTDFKHAKYRSSTDLSEYIWSLKDKEKQYTIKWEIVESLPKFKPTNTFCLLCITEKKYILFADPKSIINTRDEFVTKCRHQNKFRLNTFKHNLGNIDLLKHTEEGADMNAPAESTDFNINVRK